MFQLPDLPYSYAALEPYIDEQTMRIHHNKHHGTYVTNLNDALKEQEKLLSMDVYKLMNNPNLVPEAARMKVRNNGGGHANHTFFWQMMAPKAGGQPVGKVGDAINTTFGGFAAFQEAFEKAGIGRFGSGWVWLVTDGGKLTITDTPNQDNPWMDGKTPILGVDVWEHAYYLKYQNKRADYLKVFWNVVNWKEVEHRFQDTK